MKRMIAGLLLAAMTAGLAAAGAVVRVGAAQTIVERPHSLVGANIEDLNFQLYGGLYSQLLHGECFEEHVDPSDWLGLTGSERLAVWVVPDAQGEPVLRQFTGRFGLTGAPEAAAPAGKKGKKGKGKAKANNVQILGKYHTRFVNGAIASDELLGMRRRQFEELVGGNAQVSRHWRKVQSGSAAGALRLVRQGVFTGQQAQEIRFESGAGELGIDNAGLFREGIALTAGKPYEGILRIKSAAAQKIYVSLRAASGKVLAETALDLASRPNEYQRLEFTLTPAAADPCGRFALTLKAPGAITVDYAFLQAGAWGRYKGLPVRKEMAEAIVGMGVATMRYNGSMVNRNPEGAEFYKWKRMTGPRDERVPYHGFFNPYSSHGFSVFEFMDFCEAAGIWPIFGLRTDETEQDMKDFVEYCLGGPATVWGRRRIADGHPAPYNLKAIEIGNEERLDAAYIARVKALGGAIWSMRPYLDVVLSVNVRTPQPDLLPEFTELGRWAKSLNHQEGQLVLDSHYLSATDTADTGLERMVGLEMHRALNLALPGYVLRLMPMEENGDRCDWARGLAHAHNMNTMNRMPVDLVRAGVANTFQAHDLALIWNQGRIHFTPSQIVFQPSYYVDRMFADEWLPRVVRAECDVKTLDVTAKTSADDKVLTIYLVNLDAAPAEVNLDLKGFNPGQGRATQIHADSLEAKNTPEAPQTIVSQKIDWHWDSSRPQITLPGRSFTSLRLVP